MYTEESLCIPFPENFSFRECRWFLDRGYDDCLHVLKGNEIIKALRVNGQVILVCLSADDHRIKVDVLYRRTEFPRDGDFLQADSGDMGIGDDTGNEPGADILTALREHISGWFDLGRDITPFYELLKKDKRLAYLAYEYRGLRLIGIVDLFEALCWSVIGQQINLRFAYTLKRRLVEEYGERLEVGGEVYYLFPDHMQLAGATVEKLRSMQFSASKARYLTGLAEAFANGDLSREKLEGLPDMESRLQALMALKGIGPWTANYCLMKTLREPSCIPHGDTGLLTALANHGIIKEREEVEKITRLFRRYRGWESYLVFYLWRSLAGAGRGDEIPPR